MSVIKKLCILMLPTLLTAVAITLLVFPFFGSINNTAVLNQYYVYSFDTSELYGLSSETSEEIQEFIKLALSAFDLTRLNGTINVGLWGYCIEQESTILNCTNPVPAFALSLDNVLGDTTSSLVTTLLQTDDSVYNEVQSVLDTYTAASKAMFSFYCAAFGLAVITFICSFCSHSSRFGLCCISIAATAATICAIIASALATFVGAVIRNEVNKYAEEYGITAAVNNQNLIVTWVSTGVMFIGTMCWYLSICCCASTRKRSNSYSSEDRPIVYAQGPYTNQPYNGKFY
ncbi:hypothetical protein CANCADRAFT_30924 [Tortispora caseinolytica NRRL Y-17796]|uniref:SUR7 family protein pun1 n=1 Tax=Tortispora caseinolytica NRRL Y-17796 TaxID=767744 RepID=A0A1E4TME1_9ASCO|nr:hypothetical protein CANCADRAFT_30924 [Tortispora caseinolytica NRRL Y-17796]